jgi:hemoglobin
MNFSCLDGKMAARAHVSAQEGNSMAGAARNSGKSLYERLGGYDVIAAIMDEFLATMRNDPRFARFGGGRCLDSVRRTRQLIVDQLCELAGGPCVYSGRNMKTSHAGLGITQDEWEASLRHVDAALGHASIPPQEAGEFLSLFEHDQAEIVEG